MSSELLGNLASCTTVTMATCILKDVERVFKHKVRKAVFTEMFAWDLMSNFTRALVSSFIETWCNARSFPVGEKIGQPRAATNLYTTILYQSETCLSTKTQCQLAYHS